VAPMEKMEGKLIRGICGQVDGSIIPGMLGMEAGQSAFGDVYAWFKDLLMWPLENIVAKTKIKNKKRIISEALEKIMDRLAKEAENRPINPAGIVSVDWFNGRRTPFANQLLKGAITGLNLGSDAPGIYKSLVESTAFGAKKIVECFKKEGVEIKGVIALGGIPKKSPYIMQTVADVLDMPVKVCASEQACALGAAMFAATVCGIYPKVENAQNAMSCGFDAEYKPLPENSECYEKIYERYCLLGEFLENYLTLKERGTI